MTSPTIVESVDSFLKWAAARFKVNTLRLYRHYLYRFRDSCGKEKIDELTRLDVETFSTKKHPLEVVRRWLRWCVDVAEVLNRSPAAAVVIPKSGRRSRIMTRREMVTIRRSSGPHLRALLLALEETGARPIEVRQARWDMIRSSRDREIDAVELSLGVCYFELESFKGQARRTNPYVKRIIPISSRLGRLLARLLRGRTASMDQVFTARSGLAWTRNSLRCCFRRVLKRHHGGAKIHGGSIVPYTYRHSLATRLAKEGTQARLLADFLGHSSLDLLSWYVHPSTADLCKLVERRRI